MARTIGRNETQERDWQQAHLEDTTLRTSYFGRSTLRSGHVFFSSFFFVDSFCKAAGIQSLGVLSSLIINTSTLVHYTKMTFSPAPSLPLLSRSQRAVIALGINPLISRVRARATSRIGLAGRNRQKEKEEEERFSGAISTLALDPFGHVPKVRGHEMRS